MKIGHLVIASVSPPLVWALLGFRAGDPSMVPVIAVLSLALLGAFLHEDLMRRSLGEVLLHRAGDDEADEALHRALVTARWESAGRKAQESGADRRPARHRHPLQRRARRPGPRGPVRTV